MYENLHGDHLIVAAAKVLPFFQQQNRRNRMKNYSVLKNALLGAAIVTLAACSTGRHSGSAGDMGGEGTGGSGGENGAYSQGLGGGESGFQPSISCNVPQPASGKISSYYFDYDKSDIHSEDMSRLQTTASSMTSNPSKIHVVGNTDNRGSREYNIALGWRRANSVASALEQSGVSKQQISTNSNGAEKPIAFGTSDDDYQCNRRVDVTD